MSKISNAILLIMLAVSLAGCLNLETRCKIATPTLSTETWTETESTVTMSKEDLSLLLIYVETLEACKK